MSAMNDGGYTVELKGKKYRLPMCIRDRATDGVPYDRFVKKGLITLSGENYVDYHLSLIHIYNKAA